MCGICGYISQRNIVRDALRAMNDTMAERGPDDAGAEQWALPGGYTLGMAQRRLSILDLSPLGHQPMSTPDGRLSLVYNGEIYNYREIREQIPEYPFRSNCDTEVILAAYQKWGIDCVSRFNGMFAIALYDRGTGELFLARDRAGQKPLYYWLENGGIPAAGTGGIPGDAEPASSIDATGADAGGIVFASVLAPIMTCPGFPKRVRRDVLPRYLYQEYINAPDTIFEDVWQVEPGCVVIFRPYGERVSDNCVSGQGGRNWRSSYRFAVQNNVSQDNVSSGQRAHLSGPSDDSVSSGSSLWEDAFAEETVRDLPRLSTHRYWSAAERYRAAQEDPVTDFEEAKTGLKDRLQASVRRRMIADVPLGTFLSGGYDSSLISALAQEQLGGDTRLQTFSVGFREEAYDESPYARAVARHLGTDHTEMIIDEQDMLELVADLPKYFDEPMADSSQIPTMLVSKTARQKVTVALSGDAGDEFYCGYGIYDRVRQAQQLDGLGVLAHAIGQLPSGGGKSLEDRYPFRMRVISANRDRNTKTQFGAGSYVELARSLVLPYSEGREEAFRYHVQAPDRDMPPCSEEKLRTANPDETSGSAERSAGADLKTAGTSIRTAASGIRWNGREYAPITGGFLSVNYETESGYPSGNWQIIRMLLDMDTYLPGDILTKVDRASMKYSLESRCPFLDPDVMEYSFRIDHGFKYHKEGRTWSKKYILKSIAYDYIPKELLERPKKGFSVPLSSWLRGPLRAQLQHYADTEFLRNQGLFDADRVTDLVSRFLAQGDAGAGTGRNYAKLVWSFFVFQQWAEYWGV